MNKYISFIKKRKGEMEQTLTFQVHGESMFPVICNGDQIKVDLEYGQLEEGDIILYKAFDTHFTVHRIIGKVLTQEGLETFITKGDNNSLEDLYRISKDDIIGIVRI